MQRTNVMELKPTKSQIKILDEMMLLSSSVYNMVNYEYLDEYFVNTFVNTFLREVNTMNTLRVNNYFLLKKYSIIRSIVRVCVCICLKSIHSIHQQIQSIHDSIQRVFINSFIRGF